MHYIVVGFCADCNAFTDDEAPACRSVVFGLLLQWAVKEIEKDPVLLADSSLALLDPQFVTTFCCASHDSMRTCSQALTASPLSFCGQLAMLTEDCSASCMHPDKIWCVCLSQSVLHSNVSIHIWLCYHDFSSWLSFMEPCSDCLCSASVCYPSRTCADAATVSHQPDTACAFIAGKASVVLLSDVVLCRSY